MSKEYFCFNENNQFHCDNGPAIIKKDGLKEWWLNGKIHNDKGPARIWPDGSKEYWNHGKLHREDGPAMEFVDIKANYWSGGKYRKEEYWFKGFYCRTKEEFKKLIDEI